MTALETAPHALLPSRSLDDFVPYGTNECHPAKAYAWVYEFYAFCNYELFDGKLPKCLLTFQRKINA